MNTHTRPRIAILTRFSDSASALRHRAVVTARALAESVWNAGGDPVMLLPAEDSNWAERLHGISGVLMPGGGDIHPSLYNEEPASDALYDMDLLQDHADASLVRFVIDTDIPLFTICRGTQLTNAVLGGNLVQDMDVHHRNHVHTVTVGSDLEQLGLAGGEIEASCYHHQAIDRLGERITVLARAVEGHVEAVRYDIGQWAYGVQWHPEDNAATDSQNAALFRRFVDEARAHGPYSN